jgi:hypothetical protein
MAAWPPLVLCAADAARSLSHAFVLALRAAPKPSRSPHLCLVSSISRDGRLGVLSVVVVVFGRDSSRGDLSFTPAVPLPASPCDPALDRTAVKAYYQS